MTQSIVNEQAETSFLNQLVGPNALVVFSTSSGRAALDGPAGENSPFATAMFRQLDENTIEFPAFVARLRRDLLIATEGRQLAWNNNTYVSSFQLRGPGKSSARPGLAGLVEMNNVYGFASQNGLYLPPGLVGFRQSSNSPEGWKVEVFAFSRIFTSSSGTSIGMPRGI